MLDSEANEALLALMNIKRNLEAHVLRTLRDPNLSVKQLILLRKKYMQFLEKFQEVENDLEEHHRGTPEEWLAMWKGQT